MIITCAQCEKEPAAFGEGSVCLGCAAKNLNANHPAPRYKPKPKPHRKSAVAARLKTLRREADLTQRQLQDLCGVGWKSISTWESGFRTNSMKIGQLAKICQALGVSLSEFFAEAEWA